MKIIWELSKRNIKKLLRDRTVMVTALIGAFVPLIMHFAFLGRLNQGWIGSLVGGEANAELLSNHSIIAATIMFIAFFIPLTIFGFLPQDYENRTLTNFLTAPIKRSQISISYLLSSLIMGFVFSTLALVFGQIFLIITGGEFIGLVALLKVVLLLILIILSFSSLLFFLVSLIKTEQGSKGLSGLMMAVVPLISGVYFPLSMLPDSARSSLSFLPFPHAVTLLKQEITGPVLEKVSQTTEIYDMAMARDILGMDMILFNETASQLMMVGVLFICFVIFGVLSVLRYKNYKVK